MKHFHSRSTKIFKGLCLLALAAALFTGCNNPAGGDPDLTGTVSVAGTARVGEVLTANIADLQGEGEVSYQWQRGEAPDGEFAAIADAEAASYTLAAADEGKYLRVAVSRAGYSGTKVSEAKGPVEAKGEEAGPDETPITWTAAANGAPESTSTAIIFTFSGAVSLVDTDISVTNGTGSVTKGTLAQAASNNGTVWTLGISVVTAGDVNVNINKTGLESGPKTVTVQADNTWTAQANGTAGALDSTAIIFRFGRPVADLDVGDITVTDGTGSVTKGAIDKAADPNDGTVWELDITVVAAGDVEVSISKAGIASGPETVTVHKRTVVNDLQDLPIVLSAISGDSAEAPYTVVFGSGIGEIDTGATSAGVWAGINDAVSGAGKYVILDLSACTATGNSITGDTGSNPQNNKMNIIKSNQYIKGIILPANLTTIGIYAFSGCTYLTSISIPEMVTSINTGAFANCAGLTGIDLPENLTTIMLNAFRPSGLTSITIPGKVTTLGKNAFNNCANLTRVTFKERNSAQYLYPDTDAFSNCNSLNTFVFEDTRISFYSSNFPGFSELKTAYTNGGAGTYVRNTVDNTWSKQ